MYSLGGLSVLLTSTCQVFACDPCILCTASGECVEVAHPIDGGFGGTLGSTSTPAPSNNTLVMTLAITIPSVVVLVGFLIALKVYANHRLKARTAQMNKDLAMQNLHCLGTNMVNGH